MGIVPPRLIPPARRRLDEAFSPGELQWGAQWNSELRRLAARVLVGPHSEDEPSHNVLQTTATARRRFQILTKHREEEIAQRQAETAFADLCRRYPCQICSVSRGVLRERFLDEGKIGYVINGEIELLEATIALPDGMCLAYGETASIPGQRPW